LPQQHGIHTPHFGWLTNENAQTVKTVGAMVSSCTGFTLTNPSGLSIADFVPNSDGYLFGADVGVVVNDKVTGTGPEGALALEPASIALFGTGMLAIAFVRRTNLFGTH
jgi:hypothetical protein